MRLPQNMVNIRSLRSLKIHVHISPQSIFRGRGKRYYCVALSRMVVESWGTRLEMPEADSTASGSGIELEVIWRTCRCTPSQQPRVPFPASHRAEVPTLPAGGNSYHPQPLSAPQPDDAPKSARAGPPCLLIVRPHHHLPTPHSSIELSWAQSILASLALLILVSTSRRIPRLPRPPTTSSPSIVAQPNLPLVFGAVASPNELSCAELPLSTRPCLRNQAPILVMPPSQSCLSFDNWVPCFADASHLTAAPNLNLTPDEKRAYGQLFRQADADNVGVVTGETAVKFFDRTRLDSRVLGEVGPTLEIPPPQSSC